MGRLDFTVFVEGVDIVSHECQDGLFESGDEVLESLFGGSHDGEQFVHIELEADEYEPAVRAAVRGLTDAVPGMRVREVRPGEPPGALMTR